MNRFFIYSLHRCAILGALLFLTSNTTYAQQAILCAPPKVEIEIISEPAPINNHASVRTMTKYANSSHPTVGLYRAHQRVYIRTTRQQSKDTQELCIRNIYVSYAINHVIDIGYEYKPGTCAYEETVRHERTHERIHLNKAKEAEEVLSRELGKYALYFTGKDYQSNADKWLNQSVNWASSVYKAFIVPAQDAFDSPQEYERFAKTCERELRYQGYAIN